MQGLLPVFKRELLAYFHSPVAYVFMIIFLMTHAASGFLLGNFYNSNQASLESFFLFHPWLYLFLIPAIGMRLWSEEKRSGTIELLLSLPIDLRAAVLGKFLAAWLFIALALVLTFPIIITVSFLGSPDVGPIISGYLGSLLMAGAYLSITSYTSSITKNQVVSFILSLSICLVLVLLGWGVLNEILNTIFPVWITDFVAQLSFTTHFNALRRGVIEISDIIYFVSIIVAMLSINMTVLNSHQSA